MVRSDSGGAPVRASGDGGVQALQEVERVVITSSVRAMGGRKGDFHGGWRMAALRRGSGKLERELWCRIALLSTREEREEGLGAVGLREVVQTGKPGATLPDAVMAPIAPAAGTSCRVVSSCGEGRIGEGGSDLLGPTWSGLAGPARLARCPPALVPDGITRREEGERRG